MRFIPERFKHNGLFIVMFLITVMMIITVSITITWTTFRMSEQFFIKKFSINNSKVMEQVKESLGTFNYSVVIASNNLLTTQRLKVSSQERNKENVGHLLLYAKRQMDSQNQFRCL